MSAFCSTIGLYAASAATGLQCLSVTLALFSLHYVPVRETNFEISVKPYKCIKYIKVMYVGLYQVFMFVQQKCFFCLLLW